jgi:hypothetical protein
MYFKLSFKIYWTYLPQNWLAMGSSVIKIFNIEGPWHDRTYGSNANVENDPVTEEVQLILLGQHSATDRPTIWNVCAGRNNKNSRLC